MSRAEYINVIGAGLAGSEAAWQAARLGVPVRLYEMKPHPGAQLLRFCGACLLKFPPLASAFKCHRASEGGAETAGVADNGGG